MSKIPPIKVELEIPAAVIRRWAEGSVATISWDYEDAVRRAAGVDFNEVETQLCLDETFRKSITKAFIRDFKEYMWEYEVVDLPTPKFLKPIVTALNKVEAKIDEEAKAFDFERQAKKLAAQLRKLGYEVTPPEKVK